MGLPQPLPGCFGELRALAQVLGHQLVLGGEVAIERHFVGAGRLGDGIDPNRPYSLSVKEVARSRQDPRAGRNSVIFSLTCLISGGHGTFPLDTGVTGQYLFRCYRSVPQGEATVTCFPASQLVRSDKS